MIKIKQSEVVGDYRPRNESSYSWRHFQRSYQIAEEAAVHHGIALSSPPAWCRI